VDLFAIAGSYGQRLVPVVLQARRGLIIGVLLVGLVDGRDHVLRRKHFVHVLGVRLGEMRQHGQSGVPSRLLSLHVGDGRGRALQADEGLLVGDLALTAQVELQSGRSDCRDGGADDSTYPIPHGVLNGFREEKDSEGNGDGEDEEDEDGEGEIDGSAEIDLRTRAGVIRVQREPRPVFLHMESMIIPSHSLTPMCMYN
jgi:hypothetical protein